ncbi:MAG: hypothetical protein FJ313_04815 [Gemmatimonadetes bacterium]|nr:hypothetical protein [Gemmatimonadota bacterium]
MFQLFSRLAPSTIAATAALIAVSAVACASGGGSAGGTGPSPEVTSAFTKVTPSERVYTVEDLRAIGMRANLQYRVEGLPNAVDAWRCIYQQKEFEARFYSSHQDAVEYGTPLADEATGPDAILFGEGVSWKEGIMNRKICGHFAIGSAANAGCNAKFGDYAIYGNLVLLCEGENSEESLARCAGVLENLE